MIYERFIILWDCPRINALKTHGNNGRCQFFFRSNINCNSFLANVYPWFVQFINKGIFLLVCMHTRLKQNAIISFNDVFSQYFKAFSIYQIRHISKHSRDWETWNLIYLFPNHFLLMLHYWLWIFQYMRLDEVHLHFKSLSFQIKWLCLLVR